MLVNEVISQSGTSFIRANSVVIINYINNNRCHPNNNHRVFSCHTDYVCVLDIDLLELAITTWKGSDTGKLVSARCLHFCDTFTAATDKWERKRLPLPVKM